MILPGKLDTLQSGALQGQVPEALTPSPGDTHAGTHRLRTDIAGHGGEGRQAEGGRASRTPSLLRVLRAPLSKEES